MASKLDIQREEFPLKEFVIPQVGTNGVTGVPGTLNWGALNRPDARSRWVIGDADFDDLINFLPQAVQIQQVPYRGNNFATLAANLIWMRSSYIGNVAYLYCLCANGHIYQVSTTGLVTDINPSGGFSTSPPCDLTNWQGTTILISDPTAQNVYSWNGSLFATVFSSQPATHVEVFQGRLWMFNALSITWTNVNTYNSLSGDAGSVEISDNDTNSPIVQALSFLGTLYLWGSNWIKTISGLQDMGLPSVLIFNLATLSNQVGVGPNNGYSVIPFGNIIYFADQYGIWMLAGSAPVKVSQSIDGFYMNLDFTKTSFSSGYTTIYETPCLFFQAYYNGDLNVPAGYCLFGCTLVQNQPNQWFRVSQGIITWCASVTANVTNQVPLLYGCDGTDLFQMFALPETVYSFQFDTKIWDITGSKIDYKTFSALAIFGVLTNPTTINVNFINEYGAVLTTETNYIDPSNFIWSNMNQTFNWTNAGSVFNWTTLAAAYYPLQYLMNWTRRGLGLNVTGIGAQTIIQSLVVGYRENRASFGP